MPMHSLPIEIISEITRHLRTPLKSDTRGAIEAGQSISLVCRRWYPIGQALRWKDLEIGTASVPSLLAHFDLYPHLARFVASFKLRDRSQSTSGEDAHGEGVDALPRLLSVWRQLESLDLRQLSANLPVVMRSAAPLQHLTELYLNSDHRLDWNEDLISTLVAGFPALRGFSFTASQDLVLEDDDSITTAPRIFKKVQNMSLLWYTSKGSNVVHRFLSIFDPTFLSSCSLIAAPACAAAYEWLVGCPQLSRLRVAIVSGELTSNFPALLCNISKFRSLKWIEYRVFGRTRDDFYIAPVSLEVILVAVPSTLDRFRVPNLLFADSDESHDLPIPDSVRDDDLCLLEGAVRSDEGYRCAVIWKDKGDKKSKKGHRIVLDFEYWADVDETIKRVA